MWYPQNKHELNETVNRFLKTGKHKKPVIGLIVPHAGYEYSGAIAGTAYSLVKKDSIKKAIVVGPSHYVHLYEGITTNLPFVKSPLGTIKTFNNDFLKGDIEQEHSISVQYPFLQKLGIQEVMPLMVGKITDEQALEIAKKISKIKALYIFSTDLSHFLPYEKAVERDKETIRILENLDLENFKNLDACGHFPLLIMTHLCKLKKIKPKLLEYKNSGDVTGDKDQGVVGYSSFWF